MFFYTMNIQNNKKMKTSKKKKKKMYYSVNRFEVKVAVVKKYAIKNPIFVAIYLAK